MGVKFRVLAEARTDREPELRALVFAAFRRAHELELRLSHYREDSELSRLGHRLPGESVRLGDDLAHVLGRALEFAAQSEGAFDPTLGAWTRFDRSGGDGWDAAGRRTGWQQVRFDPETKTYRTLVAGLRLDLGGCAKGYAADEISRLLDTGGFPIHLVDAGGDLALGDAPSGRAGWKVGVATSTTEEFANRPPLLLARCGVATSGSVYRQDAGPSGRSSHLLDGRRGRPLDARRAATVRAGDALTADALATAACVLGPTPRLERLLEVYEASLVAIEAPDRDAAGPKKGR